MTDLNQQATFRELRKEAESRGIVNADNAKQTKDELAQKLTAARIQDAIGGRKGLTSIPISERMTRYPLKK